MKTGREDNNPELKARGSEDKDDDEWIMKI